MELLHYQNLLPEEGTDLAAPQEYEDRTYALKWQRRTLRGYVEGIDALKQRVYKILATEKGAFPIYSDTYGVAVDDLWGRDHNLAESELKRRITQALESDSNIEHLDNFSFTRENDEVYLTFDLYTALGQIEEIKWRFTGI